MVRNQWKQKRLRRAVKNAQKSESHLVVSDSLWSVHGILQTRILEQVAFPFSRGSSQPKDWTQVSHIAGRFSLPAELHEKPKKNGVGSLSLLQQIFPTQALNQALLHYRRILYQLSCTPETNTTLWINDIPTKIKKKTILSFYHTMATGPEKVNFHPNPKERQCQRMFKLQYSCIHFTC